MFGTDDVIYVPENHQLVLDDVYHWRRHKFDVRRFGVRLRSGVFDEVTGKMRAALDLCTESPRFTDSIKQITANTEQMIRDLAAISSSVEGSLPGSLADFLRVDNGTWWVRIGDLPAESYFDEDYERTATSKETATPYLTYGMANLAQLDGLIVDLPGTDEDGLPFAVDVPADNGITRWTIPATEPLPLVREYCGAHGASAYGRTVNLDTYANVAEAHQFCTPLGRVGEKLFATLYFYYGITKLAEVVGKLGDDELIVCQDLLEKSHFQMVQEGPTWRIFEREGDCVHLYSGLAGKESEGVETMPHFMLVASAGGQFDPQQRGELYEAIRATIRV